MAVPGSGQISLNDFHVEAGGSSGTQCSLNDADIRGLISKSSGVQMAFNEWYGASGQDNLAVITTGNHSITTTGKFGSTTFYYGYDNGTGYFVNNMTLGSSSNNGFALPNGVTFDIVHMSSNVGMLSSNVLYLTGNYNNQTLQQATGYRYVKNGTTILFDSNQYFIGGSSSVGSYNSTMNATAWSYYVSSGTAGYVQAITMPTTAGTTLSNIHFSN